MFAGDCIRVHTELVLVPEERKGPGLCASEGTFVQFSDSYSFTIQTVVGQRLLRTKSIDIMQFPLQPHKMWCDYNVFHQRFTFCRQHWSTSQGTFSTGLLDLKATSLLFKSSKNIVRGGSEAEAVVLALCL